MRTILFLSVVLLFGLVSCNNTAPDKGVEINGVRWATSNVGAHRTFAQYPESVGGLFTWYEAQHACPIGWRLPTVDELRSLADAGGEWTAVNGRYGRTFGTAPNYIFLPAAGINIPPDRLANVGDRCHIWSSTQYSDDMAWNLNFHSENIFVAQGSTPFGFSVRCVAE